MVSQELKDFIYHYFENIEQLRIILMLFASPKKQFTLIEFCSALYLPPERLLTEIRHLEKKGLVVEQKTDKDLSFRYDSPSEQISETIQQISEMDRERPVTLINLVYNRPKKQIEIFSDAFKLKKDE